VRVSAERINRLRPAGYAPIVAFDQHHDAARVYELYRAADLCYVSSLHDGMNLVAKEFVASRDDEQGVLLLSQFTGAARELAEALIVNPYDLEQTAAADAPRAQHVARRAARAHALDAPPGAGIQRLSLGGSDAGSTLRACATASACWRAPAARARAAAR